MAQKRKKSQNFVFLTNFNDSKLSKTTKEITMILQFKEFKTKFSLLSMLKIL